MLKKTMTYIDYEGEERTEDFYFNLSKAELTEMDLTTEGGLEKVINKIIAEKNNKEIVELFKDLILKAYGEKSLDGKRFIKSKELRDAFMQTEAYSNLFIELLSDANAAANFVNGIIPASMNPKITPMPPAR